ncbi:MAG: histidine phosphatase family protein [Desulfobacterales bacterium]|nr:histidine phosphatase family protein [Desulfobacterales bacterium]
MGILYFIRHGQASFGTGNYDRLSDLGIRQSQVLGRYLRKTGLRFQAIYSGALVRQQQTAQTVMEHLYADEDPPELETSSAFNEFDSEAILKAQMEDLVRENPGLAPDLKRMETDPEAFHRVFDRALARLLTGASHLADDLTVAAFIARVKTGIERVALRLEENQNAAVFTSGGTLAAVMHAALTLSEKETVRLGWQIRNASVSRFLAANGRLTLMSFNCTAHLEQENDAALMTYL